MRLFMLPHHLLGRYRLIYEKEDGGRNKVMTGLLYCLALAKRKRALYDF